MLPKRLSNGICSLNAGEDRLSMACEMEISAEGKITSYEILPVVIHVYRRLTYTIVNKLLVDRDPQFVDDNADILPMMENLAALRNALKKRRQARGSIDFELPEVKVKLDAEGHPVALVKRVGSLAESMIEECMLAANETVAEHMDKKHLPFIYRVHEQPTSEKLDRLNELLAAFGLSVHKDAREGTIAPRDVQKVLAAVAGKPEEKLVSSVSLRSMQQARYAAESLGHFGLAARYYTHFTSPIRRYPDLIVHRLLRETFQSGGMTAVRQEKLREKLPEIAQLASERERIAVEAERETTDMKKIEYMAQFVGETFTGIISGVTAFGIFVELDNGVEGLVHVSSMTNDYYAYEESQYALVGERTRSSYRMGDTVEVILARANVEERNIDFVLKDNGVYVPQDQQSAKGTKPAAGRKNGRKPSAEAGKKDSAAAKKGHSDHKHRGRKKPAAAKKTGMPAQREAAKKKEQRGAVWPDPPKHKKSHAAAEPAAKAQPAHSRRRRRVKPRTTNK